ncbi:MAG: glycosyltransferase [Lachnospiraceae bacterium]|nr:glycosyltransferase [Lachnospiraceae bacterium]
MKVSVVMTCYNGEKYIEKQLLSIRDQTYKPDEVIIADDRSNDDTYQIVSAFIENNDLNGWSVYQNTSNLGVIMNFYSAMKKASGDFVFFCDQDDIWELSKIDEMVNIIKDRQEILVLMSKENRIDENDQFIQYTDAESSDVKRIGLSEEVRECLGAGHLLVLRKSFIDQYIDALISAGMTFDVPFCVVAAARSGLYQYDRRLVKRRIHGNNTSGIKQNRFDRIKDYDKYVRGRRMRLGYFEFLCDNWENIADEENKGAYSELNKAIGILQNSVDALKKRKLAPLLKELFSWNKFLNKSISVANILAVLKPASK